MYSCNILIFTPPPPEANVSFGLGGYPFISLKSAVCGANAVDSMAIVCFEN